MKKALIKGLACLASVLLMCLHANATDYTYSQTLELDQSGNDIGATDPFPNDPSYVEEDGFSFSEPADLYP